MTTPCNSLDISQSGLVKFDGSSTFTGVTLTNHSTLVGSTSNNITSIGPSATAGQIYQSGGVSADPSFSTATYPSTAGTAGKSLISDGTNIVLSTPTFPNASAAAGKFIQSDGTNWVASTPKLPTTAGTSSTLLRSNGTDWINTSAFTVSSSDIMTNTAQPGGGWFVQASTTNVTGDGTSYQVVFGATTWEQGSNFNTGTGTYTCPVTGIYQITGMITLTGLSASFNAAELSIKSSAGTFTRQLFNPGIDRDSSNNLSIVFSGLNYYTATSTIYITIAVSGGTKTVGIKEESFGQYSYLNIMKVA